jgi:hypothetical protein
MTGPSAPGSQGTAGINIAGGPVSHVHIAGSRIHDNSSGVIITNTGTVGSDVSGIMIDSSKLYSNANDALLATTSSLTGGNILGLQVSGNEIYCNGWPANGVGFSPNCTPGFQQSGAGSSSGGVGVDLIQQGVSRVLRPVVTGNVIHDNVYEGVSPTSNVNSVVNTSGTAVTWVSGPTFPTSLIPGQYVLINGVAYQVATVPSGTSMVLQTSAGTQTSVQIQQPVYMGAVISNNTVSLSGNASLSVGPCFYNQLSDGNSYSNNVATNCQFAGFENFYSSFLTYSGDKAYGNNLSSHVGMNAGFVNFHGMGVSYTNVGTGDAAVSPTQTVGVLIDSGGVNTYISSQGLNAVTPVQDGGTNTASLLKSALSVKWAFGTPIVNTAAFQQVSVTGCTTPATLNGQCGTTITLPVAEPDTNYNVQCAHLNALVNLFELGAGVLTTTTFNWYYANLGSASGNATLNCTVTHF